MSLFQLKGLGGNTWPPLPDARMSQVWAAYLTLDRTQWLSHAEIERQQFSQLRTLLNHCQLHVPYYRALFAKLDLDPNSIHSLADLRRIPLIDRRAWQDRYDQLAAEALPAGMTYLGEDRTSGTTGVPVRVRKTNYFQLWWFAFYLRDLHWCNIDAQGSIAVIRPTFARGEELQRHMQGVSSPHWHPGLAHLLATGPLFAMDILQGQHRQVQWLQEIKANYLLSYPSNLETLARIVQEERRTFPSLRGIQAISETLTDEARAKIESAFGVPVHNIYSCTEAGYVASPCPEGHGLHVHSENVILEVLDESGQPCQPGETGRVVLTVLNNFSSPLIRYEIADEVTLAANDCPCGRGLPLLTRVLGKSRPTLHLPDGRRKASTNLAVALSGVGGHHQHQLIQKTSDSVVLRIVPNQQWTDQHPQRFYDAIQEFFEGPIRVHLELRDRLELPANGKLRSIVSEIV